MKKKKDEIISIGGELMKLAHKIGDIELMAFEQFHQHRCLTCKYNPKYKGRKNAKKPRKQNRRSNNLEKNN